MKRVFISTTIVIAAILIWATVASLRSEPSNAVITATSSGFSLGTIPPDGLESDVKAEKRAVSNAEVVQIVNLIITRLLSNGVPPAITFHPVIWVTNNWATNIVVVYKTNYIQVDHVIREPGITADARFVGEARQLYQQFKENYYPEMSLHYASGAPTSTDKAAMIAFKALNLSAYMSTRLSGTTNYSGLRLQLASWGAEGNEWLQRWGPDFEREYEKFMHFTP